MKIRCPLNGAPTGSNSRLVFETNAQIRGLASRANCGRGFTEVWGNAIALQEHQLRQR